jgi:hypothetical protein
LSRSGWRQLRWPATIRICVFSSRHAHISQSLCSCTGDVDFADLALQLRIIITLTNICIFFYELRCKMSRFYLKRTVMRTNTSILRYKQTSGKPHKAPSHAPLAKLKRLLLPAYKFIPETIAWLLFSRCYRYWRPIFGGGVALR